MPDLTDELLRMAAEGAGQARPRAVAEVIRRGNHRRGRVIAQRSIGGLSAVGVSAAVILAGVSHAPVAPTSSSSSRGTITLTESASSSAATMTVGLRYRDEPHGRVELLSLSITGRVKLAAPRVGVFVILGPVLPQNSTRAHGVLSGELEVVPLSGNRFTASLGKRFRAKLPGNDVLRVTLLNVQRHARTPAILRIGLILGR